MHLTELAHRYLDQHLGVGHLAVDATAGNGHDCLKMAQIIGDTGKLIGIDLQVAAIEATRHRLNEAKVTCELSLIEGDHADVLKSLIPAHANAVQAITFNLGYLPGSDKSIQTTPATTQLALDCAQTLLAPVGILLVTAYRGHPGGLEEAECVAQWMRKQEQLGAKIECHEPTANRTPPILWIYQAA